jgi:hypothetical protein
LNQFDSQEQTMKRGVAIVLAAMTGAMALQLPSAVMAQKWTVNEGGGWASRAEVSRRAPRFPLRVDRVYVPAITCPTLEGYPNCHPDRLPER